MARWLKNDFKPGSKIPHDWLNTIANFWNGLAVSDSDSTGIQRQSDGRYTTILTGAGKINDTEGYGIPKYPDGRQTIELNPETYDPTGDSHTGERQLRNIQLVKQQSSSIPFFVSTVLQGPNDDKICGELYWAQVDAKRLDEGTSASYKSLDVLDTYSLSDKGKYDFGLYGFAGSESCTIPYSIHAAHNGHTDKTLEWRYPITMGYPANPHLTTPGTAELLSYLAAGTGSTTHTAKLVYNKRTYTVDKSTSNLSNQDVGNHEIALPVSLNYADIATAIGYDEHEHNHRSLYWIDGGSAWPYGGNCTDHDARYLARTGTSRSTWASGNTTDQIANNIYGKFGIDFGAGQLMREDGAAAAVDYKNSYLYTNAGTKMVDWVLGILYKPSSAAWTTWDDCGFYVGTGGNFGVNNGKTSLLCVAGIDALKLTTGVTGSATVQIHATAESSVPVTYLDNIRLMIGHSTSTWIGFEATAGQLLIKDNTGAELAKFTLGDPG